MTPRAGPSLNFMDTMTYTAFITAAFRSNRTISMTIRAITYDIEHTFTCQPACDYHKQFRSCCQSAGPLRPLAQSVRIKSTRTQHSHSCHPDSALTNSIYSSGNKDHKNAASPAASGSSAIRAFCHHCTDFPPGAARLRRLI